MGQWVEVYFINCVLSAFALIPKGPKLNKRHGGHVGVPDKSLIKILLNWNTNMATVMYCANALQGV